MGQLRATCRPCPACGCPMLRSSPHDRCWSCRSGSRRKEQGRQRVGPETPLRATKLEELARRAAAGLPLFQREGDG